MVAVEGLVVVIGHEQRGAQRLEQRLFADVGIRVVDKSAGLYVAARADVQLAPSAGDAAADEFAVVLEVY